MTSRMILLVVIVLAINFVSSSMVLSCGQPTEGTKAAPTEGTKAYPAAPAVEDFIEGNYWALIIGIDKYPALGKEKQLTVARKDAEAVAKLLFERYGFEKERTIELYDEKATRKSIIRAFMTFHQRMRDIDSLFIYYAGRGEYESSGTGKSEKEKVDGMGYWIPSDAEQDDLDSYISNSKFQGYLAVNIPARHVYMVVDSAFSGSLMGKMEKTHGGVVISKFLAIKELYQEKSRWALVSGGLDPVPDVDKARQGHSTFAWHFMKLLRRNTQPYLLAKDIAEPIEIRVSTEVRDMLPHSAPLVGTGDEGGQFVFRLKKEFVNMNPLETVWETAC